MQAKCSEYNKKGCDIMERIAFYDTKPYDREHFDKANKSFDIRYFEDKLSPETVALADGCKAVCAFVNDCLDARVIGELTKRGVKLLLMRCAGYNNIDLKYASGRQR